MAQPLITSDMIKDTISSVLKGTRGCSQVEIFTETPQNIEQARHGVYIDQPATTERSPYSLAVNYGGNIYIATDSFEVIFISFQGDNLLDTVTNAITDLVTNNDLMDGYHERDFNMSVDFKNRAEYRTIVFNLKRMEIQ